MFLICRVALAVSPMLFFGVVLNATELDSGGELLAARLGREEKRREAMVGEIQSVRRYTLRNPRWKIPGSMEVRMTWDGQNKKEYQIISMNAEGLQKRVLMKLLDGEVEAAAREDEHRPITPEFYDLKPLGLQMIGGRECQMMELRPKKRTKYMIDGRACIDTADAAVVFVEGRSAKSVSFWVGKPHMVQEFKKVGDFWFSSQNHSTANVKLLGKTELTIEYRQYVITPRNGAMVVACHKTPCTSETL